MLAGVSAFFNYFDKPFNLGVFELELAIVVPLLALVILSVWGSSVTELELRDDCIVFHKPLNPLTVTWEWLAPPKHRSAIGEIAAPFHPRGESGSVSWVFLTRAQMLALLAHPKCPKWDLDPAVRSSLGLRSADDM